MSKKTLSICIPSFNRIECLNNCLNSISIMKKKFKFNFEVCISENASIPDISPLIKKYSQDFEINF